MTAPYDLDRQLDAFLLEGPTELPDVSFDAIRDRTELTRQRVVFGPWRIPDMNKFIPIGLGAAAVVGVLLIGSRLLGAPSGPGGSPSLEPSAAPSPSDSSGAPPLTETFTSERHGISISYPSGWVARPATGPWTTGAPDCHFLTVGDVFSDSASGCSLWIAVASQPIGDSTPDEWVAGALALTDDPECEETEPITVDGATGLIGADECNVVAVTTDGRGYFIWLYASPDDELGPPLSDTYDRAWIEEVLATVQLHPEDAVDVAPAP